MKTDDDEHRCHCAHVTIIQTKVSAVQWFLGILLVAVVALVVNKIGDLFSLRVAAAPAVSTPNDRIFLDRVEKP